MKYLKSNYGFFFELFKYLVVFTLMFFAWGLILNLYLFTHTEGLTYKTHYCDKTKVTFNQRYLGFSIFVDDIKDYGYIGVSTHGLDFFNYRIETDVNRYLNPENLDNFKKVKPVIECLKTKYEIIIDVDKIAGDGNKKYCFLSNPRNSKEYPKCDF